MVICVSIASILLSGCARSSVSTASPSLNTATVQENDQGQTTDTSSWKTYTGNHFTIEYPTNFSLTITGKGADYLSSNASMEQFFKFDTLRNDQIVVTLLGGLLEKYDESKFQALANRLAGGTQQNVPYAVVTVDGIKAVKITYQNTEHYGIPTKDGLVWISAKPANSSFVPTFETMIATVKFQSY